MTQLESPSTELAQYDAFYREGGLQRMASPHVHYHESRCPHGGCEHRMEWIDFQLELYEDKESIYNPLVRSWWEGPGFVGRCPMCDNWIRFTTRRMDSIDSGELENLPQLPEDWSSVAQFGS